MLSFESDTSSIRVLDMRVTGVPDGRAPPSSNPGRRRTSNQQGHHLESYARPDDLEQWVPEDRKLYEEWQRRLSERQDAAALRASEMPVTPMRHATNRYEYGVALASETLFPPGTLHVWIYQARHLVFRRLFETMYDRHGLRLRVYLESRTTSDLSEIYETPRNASGNMANPRWRVANDDARDNQNGHFAIALERNTLRSDPELIIEIVCGILVVAHTKVSLVQLLLGTFGTTPAFLATQNVQFRPHWFPLAGEDAGVVEIALEFISSTLVRETQQARNQQQEVDEVEEEPEDAMPISAAALARRRGSSGSSTIGESPRDAAALHQAQRRARYELHEKPSAGPAYSGGTSAIRRTSPVKQPATQGASVTRATRFNLGPDLRSDRIQQASSFVRSDDLIALPAPLSGNSLADVDTPDQVMDEQVRIMFEYGLSDAAPEQDSSAASAAAALSDREFSSSMTRKHSMISVDSTQSYSFSDMSEASGASYAPSSCASEILSYNDRIQQLEEAILAEQQRRQQEEQEQQQQQERVRYALRDPMSAMSISSQSDTSEASSTPSSRRKQGGVILFDPATLGLSENPPSPPPSAAEQASAAQRARMIGRRRSLPVNSLFPSTFPSPPSRTFQITHARIQEADSMSSRPDSDPCDKSISEHPEDTAAAAASAMQTDSSVPLRHRRTSSLHSISDLLKDHGPPIHNIQMARTPASTTGDMTHRNMRAGAGISATSSHGDSNNSIESSLTSGASSSKGSGSSSASMLPVPTVQASGAMPRVRRNSRGMNEVQINGVTLGLDKLINVGSVPGVIRFIGQTLFAPGIWIGIELCERKGKHNGTVQDVQYFSCAAGHGIFIRAERLDISVQQ